MLESLKTILIDNIFLPCGEQLLTYVSIFAVALYMSVRELRKVNCRFIRRLKHSFYFKNIGIDEKLISFTAGYIMFLLAIVIERMVLIRLEKLTVVQRFKMLPPIIKPEV
jgi:hypothetical protein